MLDDFRQQGIKFRSLTEAIDTETRTGRAMWQMIGVLAELERSLIVERTRAGVKAAQRGGVKFGRKPKLTPNRSANRPLALRRVLHRQHLQPAHPPGLRRACSRFFAWCEDRGLTLTTIRPFDVATYRGPAADPLGVKQQLAAVRMLFDWLITGQVVPFNPAPAVRGPKHVVKTGVTPVLDGKEWRKLIDAIPTETGRDLHDRALIATLTYSFARIGAALKMKVEDLRPKGAGWQIRLQEKGGKEHATPCHHALADVLRAYIDAAGIAEDRKGWLFRTSRGHTATALADQPMTQPDAGRMIRSRAVAVGIHAPIGNHSFGATGITAYLSNGGALEHAQEMAAHESPRTTKLYDRTKERLTQDEVERIRF
jgi:integrase